MNALRLGAIGLALALAGGCGDDSGGGDTPDAGLQDDQGDGTGSNGMTSLPGAPTSGGSSSADGAGSSGDSTAPGGGPVATSGDGDQPAGNPTDAATTAGCGGAGEACCLGDVCNGGGCCVNDSCVPSGETCGMSAGACNAGACEECGADGQACCGGNCQSGFACEFSGGGGGPMGGGFTSQCAACGGAGEACCADLSCTSGVCVTGILGAFGGGGGTCESECGAPGQACCESMGFGGPGGMTVGTCQSGVDCNGDNMCEGDPCGAPGQSCCEASGGGGGFNGGGFMPACLGTGVGCVGGTCDQCGGEGQACCDDGCDSGLECGGDTCAAPEGGDTTGTGGFPDPSTCAAEGDDCCSFQGMGGGTVEFCGAQNLQCVEGACVANQGGGPGAGMTAACDEAGEDCCSFGGGGGGGGGQTFEFCGNNLECVGGTCE